ncbi:MAG TPA: Holliday junction branch migration protein RuvA [Clostridiales bacterium]|jgi:Holliday junction DNA helicase RuvA|nr:Holliday junction branch migration protein RuvA [Clostridiales bacterium]
MFYSITGEIIMFDLTSVAINCGGVGFKCFTSTNTLSQIGAIGEKITLYTHLNVKDDALDLYGFSTINELDCFKMLITVSGVGPKAAISVLSALTPDSLALSIATGDAKSLTQAQNIGPKIAQRIILELKNKITPSSLDVAEDIQHIGQVSASSNVQEAISALNALGYSTADVSTIVARAPKGMNTEDLIKYALRQIAKGIN